MQASQEVISSLIQSVVTAQQATATHDQQRQAIELSEQVHLRCCKSFLNVKVTYITQLCTAVRGVPPLNETVLLGTSVRRSVPTATHACS